VRVRDVFAGHRVELYLRGRHWIVALTHPENGVQHAASYVDAGDAYASLETWLEILSNESEIETEQDLRGVLESMMDELVAREDAGEPLDDPGDIRNVIERDELRRWYEREMWGSE
jgi:hypothetical protein